MIEELDSDSVILTRETVEYDHNIKFSLTELDLILGQSQQNYSKLLLPSAEKSLLLPYQSHMAEEAGGMQRIYFLTQYFFLPLPAHSMSSQQSLSFSHPPLLQHFLFFDWPTD